MNHMIDGDDGRHPFSPRYIKPLIHPDDAETCTVCGSVEQEDDVERYKSGNIDVYLCSSCDRTHKTCECGALHPRTQEFCDACLLENMKEMELAAIWLNKPVVLGDGRRTGRVKTDDLVQVDNGKIVDCTTATHRVTGCYGHIYNSPLFFVVIDLRTNEPQTIHIQ